MREAWRELMFADADQVGNRRYFGRLEHVVLPLLVSNRRMMYECEFLEQPDCFHLPCQCFLLRRLCLFIGLHSDGYYPS